MAVSPREKSEAYLRHAKAHGDQNERGEWLRFANHAVLADPTYSRAWLMRGQARQEIGDLQGALSDYEHAIALDPQNAQGYYKRAWYKSATGDYLGAISDTEHALQLDPTTTFYYALRMGHVYAELGDHQRAFSYYDRAIALEPENCGVLLNRAVLHYKREEYQFSLQDLSTVLERQPTWSWAHRIAGENYLALQDYSKAIVSFSTALRYEAANAKSYFLRAEAYDAMGEIKRAEQDRRMAAELDPDKYSFE